MFSCLSSPPDAHDSHTHIYIYIYIYICVYIYISKFEEISWMHVEAVSWALHSSVESSDGLRATAGRGPLKHGGVSLGSEVFREDEHFRFQNVVARLAPGRVSLSANKLISLT